MTKVEIDRFMFPIPAGSQAGARVFSYDVIPKAYGDRHVVNWRSFQTYARGCKLKRVFVPIRFTIWLRLKI
jgi:hypothetical protein